MPRKKDENETAYDTLQELINRDLERDGLPVSPPKKEKKMKCRQEAGRKGGKAKNKLSPEKRKEIAQKAAKARWNKEI